MFNSIVQSLIQYYSLISIVREFLRVSDLNVLLRRIQLGVVHRSASRAVAAKRKKVERQLYLLEPHSSIAKCAVTGPGFKLEYHLQQEVCVTLIFYFPKTVTIL
jgi:hypothetical protein